MKRRPLFWAAVALAAGIGLAPYLWPWRPALCAFAVAGSCGLLAWYWWRRDLAMPLAVLLVLAGGALSVAPPLPVETAKRVTCIRGWLDGEIQLRANGVYRGVRVAAWRLGNGSWSKTPREVRLWAGVVPGAPEYGRWVEARGRLAPAPAAGMDGNFFIKTIDMLPRRTGYPLRRAGLALRGAMDRALAGVLDQEEHALAAGLLFGDLPQLSPETLGWFRDTGTLHVLSVSGLHIGFVVALALGAARLLGWRTWRSWLLAVPAVIAYIFICGPKPPVLRAAVMALAGGVAAVRARRADPANVLGLAAVVVLLWQPCSLGTIGFQLSFAACAGLIFLYPRWADWVPGHLGFIGKPILITLAATLAVLPIQIAHFGRVSLIGPLTNLLLVPLTGLALQIGLVAGLLGVMFPFLAGPLLAVLGLLLDLILASARLCAQIPGAACNLGAWPWPAVAGYYLLLGMVGLGMERNLLNNKPRLPLGWCAVLLAAVLAGLVWWQVLAAPQGLSVTFLDVGQGDSIFIRAPDGRTALIDGGEDEAGARVLSYLRRQGINRLDLLIVSHPHSDHVGGLAAVAGELSIGRVLDPGWPHPSETYRRFLLVLKERRIPWQRARRGLAFTLGRDVSGAVLYPYAEAAMPDELNDGSLVIRLRYGRQTLLLPGDLGGRGEEALIAAGDDLRATVLKVAHHGSATSTGPAWLAAARPREAVISVGRGNQFHHPSLEILSRLRMAGVKVYRTDERGNVRWVTDGRRYRFETAR
ncbi:MAG: DNA internalization-related competence protein ComEC/Rec2 [Bacteroidota bacterium]